MARVDAVDAFFHQVRCICKSPAHISMHLPLMISFSRARPDASFRQIDKDGGGDLDVPELKDALLLLKQQAEEEQELREAISQRIRGRQVSPCQVHLK